MCSSTESTILICVSRDLRRKGKRGKLLSSPTRHVNDRIHAGFPINRTTFSHLKKTKKTGSGQCVTRVNEVSVRMALENIAMETKGNRREVKNSSFLCLCVSSLERSLYTLYVFWRSGLYGIREEDKQMLFE